MKMPLKMKRAAAAALAALVVATGTGCSNKPAQNSTATPSSSTSATPSPQAEEFSYPMDGSVTLRWWIPANSDQTGNQQERKNNEFMQWLSEKTGVKFEFQHPPIGEEKNAFNIMCASGDMPDIVSYGPSTYTGGLQQAIDDGVALRLNDYFDEYLPNLKAYVDTYPNVARNMRTLKGDYAFFPVMSLDPQMNSWCGWQIRGDLLEKEGMSVPETINEWYETLTYLKNKYHFETGFAIRSNAWGQYEMASGFRTSITWDINDSGEVVYGPVTAEYKAFLTEMRKWYAEGLLHPDFATTDNQTAKALYTSGKSVAIADSVGSMSGFITAGQTVDPGFMTVAAPYPVSEKGATPYRGYRNLTGVGENAFISGDISKDKLETALRFMDYGYSEEGKVFYNFGKEGVSFTYADGVPTYSDLIMNNPDGLNKNTAIRLYSMAAGLPGEQMKEYAVQNNNLPVQVEALKIWSNTEQEKHAYPNISTGDAETDRRLAAIDTDLSTYQSEMMIKFIMGTESLDNFDAYVEKFKTLGLEEAKELKAKAYQKYLQDNGN